MLSELSLVDCDITDVGLKHLTELKRLKKLSLERTGVTAEGVAKLRLALPKCDVGSNIPASEVAAAVEALQKDSNQADEP
jgi:hypothetical protein